MNRIIKTLSVLLAIQLVLVLFFYWPDSEDAPQDQQYLLTKTDLESLNSLLIDDRTGSISLRKDSGSWFINVSRDNQQESIAVPADPEKIQELLGKLTETTQWPVTTTSSSHERFEVSQDNYQRRIQAFQGEQLIEDVIVGSSAGLRKLHIRRQNQENVYSVPLGLHDLPVSEDGWLDKTLLAIDSDITSITTPTFNLERENGEWQITELELTEGASLNQEKINDFKDAIAQLRVNGVHKPAASGKSETPDAQEFVVNSANKTLTYEFFKSEENHWVKRSDQPLAFSISPSSYSRFINATATDFINPAPDASN